MKPKTGGIDRDYTKKSAKNSLEISSGVWYKSVCLNARSTVNNGNELSIIAEDIDSYITSITES